MDSGLDGTKKQLIQSQSDEPTTTGEAHVDETKVDVLTRPDCDKPTTRDGLEMICEPIGACGLTNEPFETIKAILKIGVVCLKCTK